MPFRLEELLRAAAVCLVTMCLLLPITASAQDQADEPDFEQLERFLKRGYFNLGVVVQTVGDFIWDRDPMGGQNGFSIATSRLKVDGDLDFGLGYLFQTDFARSPSLIDARLSYQISPRLRLDAGLFKAPFSAEFLIAAPSIDFVNRSQVASILSPGRQVGVALAGSAAQGTFSYSAGVFNGNGRSLSGNDNDKLMYAGRVVARPSVEEGKFEIGANIALSEDDTGAFAGERLLFGGDVRREWSRWMVSGELIYADLNPELGEDRQPFGYQATVGYMFEPGRHQVLARWDSFDFDNGFDTQFIVLGYNFWPSRAFEFQANYLIPVHDGSETSDQQLLVNFQVAF